MLVLTRKPGERIIIGTDIILTVLRVRGDRVRLGFEAPPGVAIQRGEVFQPKPGNPPDNRPSPAFP